MKQGQREYGRGMVAFRVEHKQIVQQLHVELNATPFVAGKEPGGARQCAHVVAFLGAGKCRIDQMKERIFGSEHRLLRSNMRNHINTE